DEFDCTFIPQHEGALEMLAKRLTKSDVLVVDGYGFDAAYQKKAKTLVKKLVLIDDIADKHYYADLIINHGDPSIRDKYNTESYSKLLLGPDYLMLRKAFLDRSAKQDKIEQIHTAFICMGGADPFCVTAKCVAAALQCAFIKKLIIVTGSAFKGDDELNNLLTSNSGETSISREKDVDAKKMVELIRESQIAICPSSTVSLEICAVGCGLLTGMVADNQINIHEQIVNAGCCKSIGDLKSITVEGLREVIMNFNDVMIINDMLEKQSHFIDGRSGERILKAFKELINSAEV
ncbi:MAG TPA: hypothetical protein VKH37_13330, partial [Ferruginibacter sp.]|nr:hypothetical protein [Ferruginibacter sp.]